MRATFPTLLATAAVPAAATTLDFESLSRGAIITNQVLGQGVLVDSPWEFFRVTFRGLTGNVLSQQELTTTSGSVFGGATVSCAGAGIHSVEVLGIGPYYGGGVDDLTFTNSVPEPHSLTLAALALGGLTLLRRRQAAR